MNDEADMEGLGKGWWQASDGRWYPPGMARHPAARRGRTPREPAVADIAAGAGPSLRVWVVLVVPIVVIGALAYGIVGAPSRMSSVRTDAADSSSSTSITLHEQIYEPSGHNSSSSMADAARDSASTERPNPPNRPDEQSPSSPPVADPPGAGPAGGTSPSTVSAPPSEQVAIAPSHHTPTSALDCKDGGWVNLVDDQGQPFRNQGQCVSFARHL